MKNKFLFFLFCTAFAACTNKSGVPDVSSIPVTVKIERFDKAWFAMDSNQVAAGLRKLDAAFPWFTPDFVTNILGAGPLTDTNRMALAASRQFLTSYLPVKDSIGMKFEHLEPLEQEIRKGFQFVKYYFPNYRLPQHVVAFIGPFDAPGVAITRYSLAIGLQVFAGHNLSFYNSAQGQDMYPLYISRRFEADYIPADCMKAIEEDLYPDESGTKSLIEQMIAKGKYWWLLDKLMPETADSIKTGFTQKQLDWCNSNEGSVWNFFLENNDLFTIDPDLIKNFIGDAPNTQGMPQGSPGNIGQWIGYRIVQKYMENNPSLSPQDLMKKEAKKIFEETKYKPK
jgi:hypothetical protein